MLVCAMRRGCHCISTPFRVSLYYVSIYSTCARIVRHRPRGQYRDCTYGQQEYPKRLRLAIPGDSDLIIAGGECKETTGGTGIANVDNHLLLLAWCKCAFVGTELCKCSAA